jgi:hypothetical protein
MRIWAGLLFAVGCAGMPAPTPRPDASLHDAGAAVDASTDASLDMSAALPPLPDMTATVPPADMFGCYGHCTGDMSTCIVHPCEPHTYCWVAPPYNHTDMTILNYECP